MLLSTRAAEKERSGLSLDSSGRNSKLPNMPIYAKPAGSAEFAYEADLRHYLAKDLSIIEPGLKLDQDEGIAGCT